MIEYAIISHFRVEGQFNYVLNKLNKTTVHVQVFIAFLMKKSIPVYAGR